MDYLKIFGEIFKVFLERSGLSFFKDFLGEFLSYLKILRDFKKELPFFSRDQ